MLYQLNCLACHGDREGKGGSGPAPPHNAQGHTWHHPDAQLKEWVLNGRLFGGMPAFKEQLSEADVEAILAHIKTWWTEEQRQSQADVSRRYQEALDKQKKGR
jgi:mono/diheme cytochrome c family protein